MKVDLLSKSMKIVMDSWVNQEKISSTFSPKDREKLVANIHRNFKRETFPNFVLAYPPIDQSELLLINKVISQVKKLSSKLSETDQMPLDIQVSPIVFNSKLAKLLPPLKHSTVLSTRPKKSNIKTASNDSHLPPLNNRTLSANGSMDTKGYE